MLEKVGGRKQAFQNIILAQSFWKRLLDSWVPLETFFRLFGEILCYIPKADTCPAELSSIGWNLWTEDLRTQCWWKEKDGQ